MPKQPSLRRRQSALGRRTQDCDHTIESLALPEKETDAIRAFFRRHVATVKGRFYETVSIGEKVANPHELFARSSGDVILERFRSEKALRHRLCPSRDQRQNRIVLQAEADHPIGHRRGDQLLNGFPERTNVHGTVQTEQRLLQRRVDHRLPLAASLGISLQSLHVLSPCSRATAVRRLSLKTAPRS